MAGLSLAAVADPGDTDPQDDTDGGEQADR
jgi:hypothetical protein